MLKIFAARIAKVNPLTVELDLGMKVDLGVVPDRQLQGQDRRSTRPGSRRSCRAASASTSPRCSSAPGFVNIIEPPAAPAGRTQPGFGGIEGAFDVSLVPIKLRIAASFGVRPISDAASGRKATAVFLGLIIDLPAPIPLGPVRHRHLRLLRPLRHALQARSRATRTRTDAVGPAILWLKAAGGEPAKLFNNGVTLWGPSWTAGASASGSCSAPTEGGFLVNLRGMFVLELPGPRILVFVKILIVQVMPDLKPGNDLTVGILGVIDLDFARAAASRSGSSSTSRSRRSSRSPCPSSCSPSSTT